MQTIISGIPESIEVDGRTFRVRYSTHSAFEAFLPNSAKKYASASSWDHLQEAIRYEARAERREKGQPPKIAVDGARLEPIDFDAWIRRGSRFAIDFVRVTVRRPHASGNGRILIVTETGAGAEAKENELVSIDAPIAKIQRLGSEIAALDEQASKVCVKVESIAHPLRFEKLPVHFSPDSGRFVAVWKGEQFVGHTPRDLTNQIERFEIWSIARFRIVNNRIVEITRQAAGGDAVSFAGYERFYRTWADAEAVIVLTDERERIWQEWNGLLNEWAFSYPEELAKAHALRPGAEPAESPS